MIHEMEKARTLAVLDHAFFASVLMQHPMVESTAIPTMSCAYNGRITYNPQFFAGLTSKQGVFGIIHEVLHYISMHHIRMGDRDPETWNQACDAWINETLVAMGIGEPVPGMVRRPGAQLMTVEDLYDLMKQEKQPPGQGQGPGQPPPGPGQGSGDPVSNDMEPIPPGMTDGEKKEHEGRVKIEVAEAAQSAKLRGTLTKAMEKFVADIIDSKLPWWDTLEKYLTEKVITDISWSRPNRRYMPAHYLPTRMGQGAMGELVVQIDISGSVSEDEIAHYNGHLKSIVETVNPTKVHVIYTDTEVQLHEEYDQGEEPEITFHRGGGTRMEAGFDFVAEQGIEPVVLICLTDGCDSYHAANEPPYPVVWCISGDAVPPYGQTIHFDMNDKE